MKLKQISKIFGMQHSIATRLLAVVFSLYVLIAVLVTIVQMVAEYYKAERDVAKALQVVHTTIAPGIATALWDIDDALLLAETTGVIKLPDIGGVIITDDLGNQLAAEGLVQTPQGVTVRYERNQISKEKAPHPPKFFYTAPIVYKHLDDYKKVGFLTLFAESDAVLDRVGLSYIMLIVNAFIKTLALWIIFLFFSRRFLHRPLTRLTKAVDTLNLDQPQPTHIDLGIGGRNELTVLKDTLSAMNRRLNHQHELERQATELARTNARLEREAREAAERSDRAKTTFLATMSHEIHTPLNHIIGMTQVVSESPAIDERDRESLVAALGSARELLALLDNVLDFARLESGDLRLEIRQISLSELLNGTINILKPIAENKQLKLSCTVDSELPAHVRGDGRRISQIILNLANNAIKYTDSGLIAIKVEGAAKAGIEDDDTEHINIHLAISDTGPGIPDSKKDEIFHAFTQAEEFLTRRVGGLGLGLSLSASLVRLMGGRISVESTLGEGSTFHCYFPLECVQTQESPTPVPECPSHALHILVAEDNPVNQMLNRRILESWGHTVTIVEDGQLAVQATETTDYDAILMDIQMPNMDGITATRHIRAKEAASGHHIPIIAVTAHANERDHNACIEAGMDEFIAKPIDKKRLKTVLVSLAQD